MPRINHLSDSKGYSQAPRPALFLHIQKTAGSSIVDLARLAYGSDKVISHGDYLMVEN